MTDHGSTSAIRGTMSVFRGRLVISNAAAQGASNLYATFYNPDTDKMWDENSSAEAVDGTVSRANAAVACTDYRSVTAATRAADGWLVNIPTEIKGDWIIKLYNNASPTAGDDIVEARYANVQDGEVKSVDVR